MNIGPTPVASDMAAIRNAMHSPAIQAAAMQAGVDLNDPATIVDLMNKVRALMPVTPGTTVTSSGQPARADDQALHVYARQALRLYDAVALMA